MTEYAIGLEHLFWVEADDEADARAKARQQLAEMDERDLEALDFGLFDTIEDDDDG